MAFSSLVVVQDITHRLASSCKFAQGETVEHFPRKQTEKHLHWVSGQRDLYVRTGVTPSQGLLVTWLVCLISGKANKSPAARCLLRSWLHWENKPVRSVTVGGVASCLRTGCSSCCPFISHLPNNTSMQPARPRVNSSFPDIPLPKHPGLTHLRALITLNFNCLHVSSPQ